MVVIINKQKNNFYKSALRYLKFIKDVPENEIIEKTIDELYNLTNIPFSEVYPYKDMEHYFLLELENSSPMVIDYKWIGTLNNMIRNNYNINNLYFFGLGGNNTLKKPNNYYEAFIARVNPDETELATNKILHKFHLKSIDEIKNIEDPNFNFTHGR